MVLLVSAIDSQVTDPSCPVQTFLEIKKKKKETLFFHREAITLIPKQEKVQTKKRNNMLSQVIPDTFLFYFPFSF